MPQTFPGALLGDVSVVPVGQRSPVRVQPRPLAAPGTNTVMPAKVNTAYDILSVDMAVVWQNQIAPQTYSGDVFITTYGIVQGAYRIWRYTNATETDGSYQRTNYTRILTDVNTAVTMDFNASNGGILFVLVCYQEVQYE